MNVWDQIQIIARYGDKGLQMMNILGMLNKLGGSYSGQQGFAPPAPVEEVTVRPRVTEANIRGLLGHHLDKDIVGAQ